MSQKILFSLEYDVLITRECPHIKAFKKLIMTIVLVTHPTHKFAKKYIMKKMQNSKKIPKNSGPGRVFRPSPESRVLKFLSGFRPAPIPGLNGFKRVDERSRRVLISS